MGIDFLDCIFRLEKAFKIKIKKGDVFEKLDLPPIGSRGPIPEVTAGDMQRLVEKVLIEQGQPVPDDVWERVRACVAATIGKSPDFVSRESRLLKDLGFE